MWAGGGGGGDFVTTTTSGTSYTGVAVLAVDVLAAEVFVAAQHQQTQSEATFGNTARLQMNVVAQSCIPWFTANTCMHDRPGHCDSSTNRGCTLSAQRTPHM